MRKQQTPQTNISQTAIVLAVIASFVVSFALYFTLMWLAGSLESDNSSANTLDASDNWEIIFSLLIVALVLLTPVIAAVVVWLKLRKNKTS